MYTMCHELGKDYWRRGEGRRARSHIARSHIEEGSIPTISQVRCHAIWTADGVCSGRPCLAARWQGRVRSWLVTAGPAGQGHGCHA